MTAEDDWLRQELEAMTPEELAAFRAWVRGMQRKIAGVPSGSAVHHINGDPTDNRLENIRIVSIRSNRRQP